MRASARQPDCGGCHGESRNHVIDEQNTAKPDRMFSGAAIAALCMECHRRGCRVTRRVENCQDCHHYHALVNPTLDSAVIDERSQDLAGRMEAYRENLSEGERLLTLKQWARARDAFLAALRNNQVSERPRAALAMIARRMDPRLPGFRIVGDRFDPESGLPSEIAMDELEIEMVLVPRGSFEMGSDAYTATSPVHTVDLAPFYLAKREMTQAQWKALMGTNPSYHQGERFPEADAMPVEQVSWHDCQAMLVRLNQRIPGGGFRLPTEAEWEYVARDGGTYSFAATDVESRAWLRGNSQIAEPVQITSGSREALQKLEAAKLAAPDAYAPHAVATSPASLLGLYDLLGNVSEWCSSGFQSYPYDAGDGRESTTDAGARVVRGGTFVDSPEFANPALRHGNPPGRTLRWTGLRLAFSPPASKGGTTFQPE